VSPLTDSVTPDTDVTPDIPSMSPLTPDVTTPLTPSVTLTQVTQRELKTDSRRANDVRRGTRLPEDWRPTQTLADFARDQGLDPEETRERFRDFWLAKPGSGACKLDWDRTWKNWCREDARRHARIHPGVRPANGGGDVGAFARAAARMGGKEPFR